MNALSSVANSPTTGNWFSRWLSDVSHEVRSWFGDEPSPSVLSQRDRVHVSVAQSSLPAVSVPIAAPAFRPSTQVSPNLKQLSALNSKPHPITAPANWQRFFSVNTPAHWSRQLAPNNNSLQALEKQGRLSPALKQALSALENAPLAPEFEKQRNEIIQSVLQDLAQPAQIAQGTKDTCVSTVAQMKMAQEKPAEYVQLIQALVSPSGRANQIPPIQSPQGPIYFERETSALTEDHSGRSLSERLFQAAAMEFANAELHYHNDKDQHTQSSTEQSPALQSGLYDQQNRNLISALFGQVYDSYKLSQGDSPAQLLQQAQKNLDAGQSVSIGLKWLDGGHQVLLTGIDADFAVIQNPQLIHQTVKIPRTQFEQALSAVLTARQPAPSGFSALSQSADIPELAPELYLNIHDYLLNHPQGRFDSLPEELKATLSLAFGSVGLNGRHLKAFEDQLLAQPSKFQGSVTEQLDDLRSQLQKREINKVQAGHAMLAVLDAVK